MDGEEQGETVETSRQVLDDTTAGARAGRLPFDPPPAGPARQQVAACTAALLRGDFRGARQLARQVLEAPEASAEERAYGEQVLRRTDADPVALGVGLASLALFFLIVYLTLWR